MADFTIRTAHRIEIRFGKTEVFLAPGSEITVHDDRPSRDAFFFQSMVHNSMVKKILRERGLSLPPAN